MIPISDAAGRRRHFPIINLTLVAANVLVFLYELVLGPRLGYFIFSVGLIPYEVSHGVEMGPYPLPLYLTFFTSMFVHGGFLHLGGNMLYLWVFGDNVEDWLGHWGYLAFYLLAGLAGNVSHVAVNSQSVVPSVGASGAIAGVLGAYLVLFPRAPVRTLIFLGPFITTARVSALVLIGFWAVLQFLSGVGSLGVPTEQTGGGGLLGAHRWLCGRASHDNALPPQGPLPDIRPGVGPRAAISTAKRE